jgi:hypothetical protein
MSIFVFICLWILAYIGEDTSVFIRYTPLLLVAIIWAAIFTYFSSKTITFFNSREGDEKKDGTISNE